MKTLIIGAGITGLSAARQLLARGVELKNICIVDKSRGVGGRMASRRLTTPAGPATFDHGAQFFTARSDAFNTVLKAAEQAGAIRVWTEELTSSGKRYQRWCGCDGMTDLCKWIMMDDGLTVQLQTTVANLGEYLKKNPFDAVIHTAPVPQALATLNGSGLLPEPEVARQLASVQYHATVSVMLALDSQPTAIGKDGLLLPADHPDLAFISDNKVKGISTVPSITIHLTNRCSESLWSKSDTDTINYVLQAAADYLGEAANPTRLLASSVQRWRYAEPIHQLNEGCIMWGQDPYIILAGEAFDQPRVEGGYASGRAAADTLLKNYSQM